jgi:hypothetical protein
MLATPVAAVELPRPAAVEVYDGDAANAERHRRYRDWDDDDIDAGDVVAGVVLLGAIAAIAGAVKNNRDRQRYEQPYPQPDVNAGYQRPDGRGIDRAVDMCVGEVERSQERVGSVDSATRSGEGWHVSGELENGSAYSCTIDNEGRISDVNLGSYGYGTAPAEAVPEGEYDDDYYSRARENQGSAEPVVDGDLDDGRYETAQAPDFAQ